VVVDPRGESRPARLTAAVLGVFVLLLGAGLGLLLVVRNHHASPALDAREQAAVDSASREAVNLQSFRLAHFDVDFARAAGGLTGDLLTVFSSKKVALRNGLVNSKRDTTAKVTQAALEQSRGSTMVVLVTMNNYRVDTKGAQTPFQSGRFEVTVSDVKGRWLASNLNSVGLM
jgi:hypothetical protein